VGGDTLSYPNEGLYYICNIVRSQAVRTENPSNNQCDTRRGILPEQMQPHDAQALAIPTTGSALIDASLLRVSVGPAPLITGYVTYFNDLITYRSVRFLPDPPSF